MFHTFSLTVMETTFDFEEVVNLNLKIHYFFGNLYPDFDSKGKTIEYMIRAIIFVGEWYINFYYNTRSNPDILMTNTVCFARVPLKFCQILENL